MFTTHGFDSGKRSGNRKKTVPKKKNPTRASRYAPIRNRHGKSNNWKVIQLMLVVLLFFACLYSVKLTFDLTLNGNTFYAGVIVDGVPLTGFTKEEARAHIANLNQYRIDEANVSITYNDQSWAITSQQLEAKLDYDRLIDEAWELGRTGNIFQRQNEILRLKSSPYEVRTTLTINESVIDATLTEVKASVDKESQNASMTFDPDRSKKFNIKDEVIGRNLNIAPMREEIISSIYSGKSITLAAVPDKVEPKIKAADLEKATVRLARCQTELNDNEDRSNNVRIALEKFNGLIVQPGETISYNEVVGRRTEENGFKVAPEYTKEGIAEGVGGGVCQGSTTIYGALLRADLEVVKRSQHSYTVSYVPYGEDAAVADGGKDLIFKNNTDYPIFFDTLVDIEGKKVSVAIYGYPVNPNVEVEIYTEVNERIPPPESIVKPDLIGKYVVYDDDTHTSGNAKEGIKSTTYKIYKDKKTGAEISRTRVGSDSYKGLAGTTWIGVTKRSKEPVVIE